MLSEEVVFARIDELENRIRALNEKCLNCETMIENYQVFIEQIPDYIINEQEDCTALEWLEWAKQKLGYVTSGVSDG